MNLKVGTRVVLTDPAFAGTVPVGARGVVTRKLATSDPLYAVEFAIARFPYDKQIIVHEDEMRVLSPLELLAEAGEG